MELAHRSPRDFPKGHSTERAFDVDPFAVGGGGLRGGLTEHTVSNETIRQAILEMGHSWQRALATRFGNALKTGPMVQIFNTRPKKQRDRLIRPAEQNERSRAE
jgi:hypothetical protein